MILVAAALQEELGEGLDLCRNRTRMKIPGVRAWRGSIGGRNLAFLKTGVGPERSSEALRRFLDAQLPAQVLAIGYAGGLAAELRIGDLVVPDHALLLERNSPDRGIEGKWSLEGSEDLRRLARAAGHATCGGLCVTSRRIIGDPVQKRDLREQLGAVVVDMETAALAREAAKSRVPLVCVRAVSDTAEDGFLAPFSSEASFGPVTRVARILSSGRLLSGYSEWRKRAAVARASLRRFLRWHLEAE